MGLDSLVDKKKYPCLYSKAQAYGMLEAVERVITVHSHYEINSNKNIKTSRINSEISSNNVPNNITNYVPKNASRNVPTEENHRSIRTLLLGILSGAIIQANADAGYLRVNNLNEIKATNIAEFHRFKSPVEKVRQKIALDMLSASAFL